MSDTDTPAARLAPGARNAALNSLAGYLMQQYGYIPLNVRYSAAEAALRIVEADRAAHPEEVPAMPSDPTPPLAIPDKSITAIRHIAVGRHTTMEEALHDVRWVAAPVVAAELRRLGDEFGAIYQQREIERSQREEKAGKPDWTGQHFNQAVAQAAHNLFDRAREIEGQQ